MHFRPSNNEAARRIQIQTLIEGYVPKNLTLLSEELLSTTCLTFWCIIYLMLSNISISIARGELSRDELLHTRCPIASRALDLTREQSAKVSCIQGELLPTSIWYVVQNGLLRSVAVTVHVGTF